MTYAAILAVPFTKEQVAIAVSHSRLGAGHIGIGFHSVKSGPQVLHLAWHRRLEVHQIPDGLGACWAGSPLPVPPVASKQLVAFVRAVAARCPKINYGLNFLTARGSFAANGSYRPPKNSNGLTCATFVVEVLRGGRIDLIKEGTWRADAANVEWGNAVCAQLERPPAADADHVALVRGNISGLRVRPFEVAGAADLGHASWPADFDSVQAPARQVAADLASICPPAANPEPVVAAAAAGPAAQIEG
jgi:hypothetical protein